MNQEKTPYTDDTIVALATATGVGAISVIRLSGKEAIELADKVFKTLNGKPLSEAPSHTVHLGTIKNENQVIDECLATIFKGKKSYTGEPVVEFSCHGSAYITQEVIKLCLANGARLAQAGEFTKRAFLNGKLALNQAEAVADLIASDSKASHQVALQQMRGGFTSEIEHLRQELLNFASLIELELDFSEEDVEFADRSQFEQLLKRIKTTLQGLVQSFSAGNAIKNGIPVAIVGKPNAGKSTLLNTLLNEERAIVSDIAGTTRDTIEEILHIAGVTFRFIDTAGIRDTQDKIEAIGVEKAKEKIKKAQIVLYLYNEKENTTDEVVQFVEKNYRKGLKILLLHNKTDNEYIGLSDFDEEIEEKLGKAKETSGENVCKDISNNMEKIKEIIKFKNIECIFNYEKISVSEEKYKKLKNGMTVLVGFKKFKEIHTVTENKLYCVYVKNEMTEQKEFKGIVKVIRKGHDKVYLKREKYFM